MNRFNFYQIANQEYGKLNSTSKNGSVKVASAIYREEPFVFELTAMKQYRNFDSFD